MGVFQRLDERLKKEKLGHVQFQTFVCWMLFICAMLALLVPTGLVVQEIREFGCIGEEFTIVAHYGSVDWMQKMFSDFKKYVAKNRGNSGGISFEVCYRLVIQETAKLDRSYKPTIFQPQLYYWLNESQTTWQNSRKSRSKKAFVENITESCVSTTEIPMGLIIRDEFKDVFDPSEPINFQTLLDIARYGWYNYTRLNDTMSNALVNYTNLILGMGHPNVTSSGFLTLYLALEALGDTNNLNEQKFIRPLTNSTYEISPNDLFHINTLKDFSVEYLHAAIGFENDVVQYNRLQNTNLTFIYFKKTFWVDYPICVLQDAPWVNGKQKKLGKMFLNFTTRGSKLRELLDYGMRPYGRSNFQFTSNGTVDHDVTGINLNITKNDSVPVNDLSISQVKLLQEGWRHVKRPAYVLILQDVSKDVTKSVTTTKTRWVYAKKALPSIPSVLEDRAIIELACFSKDGASPNCGGKTEFNLTGNLQSTRSELVSFLTNTITTTSQKNTGFYSDLTDQIAYMREQQTANDDYNYFIVAISGDDKSKGEERTQRVNELVNATISVNSTRDEIHVFPILFFGTESDEEKPHANVTWETMEKVATNTNGRRWSADSDLEDVFDILRYYF